MASVFLSHNWRDKEFVRRLGKRLKQEGVNVWIDEAEIKIGHSLVSIISRAIEQSEYVAAIISPNSVSSNWVTKELSLAMDREIKAGRVVVLPLLIAPCDLPLFLKDKLYADFTRPENFEQEFHNLLRAIRTHNDNPASDSKPEAEPQSLSRMRSASSAGPSRHIWAIIQQRPLAAIVIILVVLALFLGGQFVFRFGFIDRTNNLPPDKSATGSSQGNYESSSSTLKNGNENVHLTEPLKPPRAGQDNSSPEPVVSPTAESNLTNTPVKGRESRKDENSNLTQTKMPDSKTKVSVRLTPVYYLGNRSMRSLEMPVTLISSAGRSTKRMDRSAYMQFDNVPCGEVITIIVSDASYNDGMFPPATYRRRIACGAAVVNLGALAVK